MQWFPRRSNLLDLRLLPLSPLRPIQPGSSKRMAVSSIGSFLGSSSGAGVTGPVRAPTTIILANRCRSCGRFRDGSFSPITLLCAWLGARPAFAWRRAVICPGCGRWAKLARPAADPLEGLCRQSEPSGAANKHTGRTSPTHARAEVARRPWSQDVAGLLLSIASPLVCGSGFAVRVESCYRASEIARRSPCHEQHSAINTLPR